MSQSSAKLTWQRTSPVAVVFFLLNSMRQIITNGLPAMVVVVAAFVSASDTNKSWMLTGVAWFCIAHHDWCHIELGQVPVLY